MSLINQVLSDLEKRGANVRPGEVSIRVVPVQRNRLRAVWLMVAVLALVFAVAWLWWSSLEPKTTAPSGVPLADVSVVQAPAKPVAVLQAESHPVAVATQEITQEDSRQKGDGEVAGSAMHLSFELSTVPLPSNLRAKPVVAATEEGSSKATPPTHTAPARGSFAGDLHPAEGRARSSPPVGAPKAPQGFSHPEGVRNPLPAKAGAELPAPLPAPRPPEGRVSDETASQSTRLAKNANQVAGYGGVIFTGERNDPSAVESKVPVVAPVSSVVPAGRVDKQIKQISVQQQADNEFRRASGLMQQGRINEALAGYEAALQLDAGHDAARQALAGLLLENKRNADAERVLQDGLKHNPKQSGFAMLLARLQVERNELALALDTLQKTLPYADQQPNYQAFVAALLQRQGRHKEAITHYQIALQLSPDSGVWLMGLGISLQAVQRNEEARDVFKRAIESRTLSAELQTFVKQQIK